MPKFFRIGYDWKRILSWPWGYGKDARNAKEGENRDLCNAGNRLKHLSIYWIELWVKILISNNCIQSISDHVAILIDLFSLFFNSGFFSCASSDKWLSATYHWLLLKKSHSRLVHSFKTRYWTPWSVILLSTTSPELLLSSSHWRLVHYFDRRYWTPWSVIWFRPLYQELLHK